MSTLFYRLPRDFSSSRNSTMQRQNKSNKTHGGSLKKLDLLNNGMRGREKSPIKLKRAESCSEVSSRVKCMNFFYAPVQESNIEPYIVSTDELKSWALDPPKSPASGSIFARLTARLSVPAQPIQTRLGGQGRPGSGGDPARVPKIRDHHSDPDEAMLRRDPPRSRSSGGLSSGENRTTTDQSRRTNRTSQRISDKVIIVRSNVESEERKQGSGRRRHQSVERRELTKTTPGHSCDRQELPSKDRSQGRTPKQTDSRSNARKNVPNTSQLPRKVYPTMSPPRSSSTMKDRTPKHSPGSKSTPNGRKTSYAFKMKSDVEGRKKSSEILEYEPQEMDRGRCASGKVKEFGYLGQSRRSSGCASIPARKSNEPKSSSSHKQQRYDDDVSRRQSGTSVSDLLSAGTSKYDSSNSTYKSRVRSQLAEDTYERKHTSPADLQPESHYQSKQAFEKSDLKSKSASGYFRTSDAYTTQLSNSLSDTNAYRSGTSAKPSRTIDGKSTDHLSTYTPSYAALRADGARSNSSCPKQSKYLPTTALEASSKYDDFDSDKYQPNREGQPASYSRDGQLANNYAGQDWKHDCHTNPSNVRDQDESNLHRRFHTSGNYRPVASRTTEPPVVRKRSRTRTGPLDETGAQDNYELVRRRNQMALLSLHEQQPGAIEGNLAQSQDDLSTERILEHRYSQRYNHYDMSNGSRYGNSSNGMQYDGLTSLHG